MRTCSRGLPSILVAIAVVASAQTVVAEELSKFQEERAAENTMNRQLTPYLDRWKTAETDTVFKDPNLQSKYQGDLPFYKDWLFLNLEAVVDGFYKHRTNPDFRGARSGAALRSGLTPEADAAQSFHRDNDFRRFISLFGFEVRNADDVFKPATWRARLIGAVDWDADFNVKDETENTHLSLQEGFVEHKIFDLGELDLSFIRLGIEPFKSDFHGLIFFDNTMSARMFGEYGHNKYRYNLAVFRPMNKDPHSNLIVLTSGNVGKAEGADKDQFVGLASLAVNDVVPGWNGEFSFHDNHDRDLGKELDAYYLGSTFNGTLGQFTFNPAAYVVFGNNKIAVNGQRKSTDILAGLVVLDAAYTLPSADFVTLKSGYVYQSGDGDSTDKTQNGFAAITDNVALFGAGGSYWVGEAIFYNRLNERNGGTKLVNTNSFLTEPGDFNAPGLHLFNLGTFLKVTQRLDATFNVNYLMFSETGGLASQVGRNVDGPIGFDFNGLIEWRPLQQKTFVIDLAQSVLIPGGGFRDVVGDSSAQFATTLDVRYIY
jgi:hypothetical protein